MASSRQLRVFEVCFGRASRRWLGDFSPDYAGSDLLSNAADTASHFEFADGSKVKQSLVSVVHSVLTPA